MWARELLVRGEREETNRMVKINSNGHRDLFPEVWFQRTYSLLRRPQKSGLFQPLTSLNRSLRPVECFFLISRVTKPARITTHLGVSCLLYKSLGELRKRWRKQPSNKSNKWNTNLSLSQVTNHYWSLVLIVGLGEDWNLWMCIWNVFFALVLSDESGKFGWLEWRCLGVFIAPTTILAVGCALCRQTHRTVRCAPDTALFIVWCTPHQSTVGVWSSWPWICRSLWRTGQSGATWHRILSLTF
jgi:hypothetical protein